MFRLATASPEVWKRPGRSRLCASPDTRERRSGPAWAGAGQPRGRQSRPWGQTPGWAYKCHLLCRAFQVIREGGPPGCTKVTLGLGPTCNVRHMSPGTTRGWLPPAPLSGRQPLGGLDGSTRPTSRMESPKGSTQHVHGGTAFLSTRGRLGISSPRDKDTGTRALLQVTWPARGRAGTRTPVVTPVAAPSLNLLDETQPREKQTSPKPQSWKGFRAQPLISQVRNPRPRKGQMLARGNPARAQNEESTSSWRASLDLGTRAACHPHGRGLGRRGSLGSVLPRTLSLLPVLTNMGAGVRGGGGGPLHPCLHTDGETEAQKGRA